MGREQFSGLLNGGDDRLHGVIGFEIGGHFGGEGLPCGIPYAGVDLFVAEDGEGLGFGGDKNQDRVAVGVVVHVQFFEVLFCSGEGIGSGGVGNEYPDLAGGVSLGLVNSLHDLVVLEAGYEIIGVHEVTNFPGSAAAETSATAGETTPPPKDPPPHEPLE